MKKAFTLIELLVVIAIITVLAAIIYPVLFHNSLHNSSKENYSVISDDWVMGHHIQVFEDNRTHSQVKFVDDQVVPN